MSQKTAPSGAVPPEQALLITLFRELFQTEQSARLHPLREAERLGDAPPSEALRAVAEHATRALSELSGLAERNDLPVSLAGTAVGAFFLNCREFVADQLIDQLVETERSYRGTLIGVRHGVDLVELISHVAAAQGKQELVDWCEGWLQERKPLVDELVQSLQWFAQSPEKATERPATVKLLGLLRSLLTPTRRSESAAVAAS